MFELLKTLRVGDHVRVNGQDAMYSDHATEYGWWLRVWLNEGSTVFVLPDAPEGELSELTFDGVKSKTVTSLSLVARPEIQHERRPIRGDWFWLWYTTDKPVAHIFWSIIGPHQDGSYTMRELSPHHVERWQRKPGILAQKYGWTNGVTIEDRVLHDRTNGPIKFFAPPFLPDCLTLPLTSTQLEFVLSV